jgi:hypothetical protein
MKNNEFMMFLGTLFIGFILGFLIWYLVFIQTFK